MALKERIANDMKEAMKAGRKTELETLRTLRAAILEFEKQKVGAELQETDELDLLTKAAKRRKEAIEQYEQAGRADLAEQETAELDIIAKYLPEQLSEDELRELVAGAIAKTGASEPKDFGKVMGMVMKEVKGRADGAQVQQLVKELLGGA